MPARFTRDVVQHHLAALERLRDEALAVERALAGDLAQVHPDWRSSARNLTHYMALRNRDLRELQRTLSALGLSSLGRAEAHTLASIDAVLVALNRIAGFALGPELDVPVDFAGGPERLVEHTRALLGPPSPDRPTHIMVTMPTAAADDPGLVRALLEAGMDCARINGAHDDPNIWKRIAAHIHEATASVGRACPILFDLPGPKLRTAPFPAGPRVLHLKPVRGPRGETIAPCRVLFANAASTPLDGVPVHDAHVPLVGPGLDLASTGDRMAFQDLRGRRRFVVVVAVGPGWRLGHLSESAWLESGQSLHLEREGRPLAKLSVGELPAVEEPLIVRPGDVLWVVPHAIPARPASIAYPARVGCTLYSVFRDVQVGEPIHFDDGKITGVVRAQVRNGPESPRLEVEITSCAPGGRALGGDKGINLPRTRFHMPALTPDDLAVLEHAAPIADLVGMSFVHEPQDVVELQERLRALGRPDTGVVLKIETARAFTNLPRLILTGMRSPPLGVMVARGDLGVELGFERLAEVQEEILWICEAAHVPVIWATQVLESLAKRGQPSRAEVTDAAMGARAECVMLNKGPYVLDAVRFLDDVLQRMQDHQQKKFSRLRRLSVCALAAEVLGEMPTP